ncbi:MAG: glucose 1-dehydrogenase [Candidatus Latescibacteria bacterium]|nr:glucose 1-dehydrogenase [Candidatus Latescibacterota bacterium]
MPDPGLARLLDLTGQVTLITGASRGIGRAMAQLFGQAGSHLALMARSQEALQQTANEIDRDIPGTALALPTDVADETQVESAVQKTLDTFGRIDILINNAGLIALSGQGRIDLDEWRALIDANLTGTFICCRAVMPIMEKQQGGRIVNISSVSAHTGGVSGGPHYASSKGGMLSLTKTLARDMAAHNVTVNAIAPGQIDADPNLLTPEARQRVTGMIPLGRLGEPEEIAYAALFLASPMAAYITGATLDVNGGILKR